LEIYFCRILRMYFTNVSQLAIAWLDAQPSTHLDDIYSGCILQWNNRHSNKIYYILYIYHITCL